MASSTDAEVPPIRDSMGTAKVEFLHPLVGDVVCLRQHMLPQLQVHAGQHYSIVQGLRRDKPERPDGNLP